MSMRNLRDERGKQMSQSFDNFRPSYVKATIECPHIIHITVQMKDDVDSVILDKTVQKVITRFPYFGVSLKREGETIISIPDNRPIVVREWTGPAYLGTKETNGHVLMVSFRERDIIFEVSHFLTDGTGFFPFVKSVLYYYLSEKYDISLNVEGIYLTNTPFFPGEMGDPFEEIDFESAAPPMYRYKKVEHLIPDDAVIKVGQ